MPRFGPGSARQLRRGGVPAILLAVATVEATGLRGLLRGRLPTECVLKPNSCGVWSGPGGQWLEADRERVGRHGQKQGEPQPVSARLRR